MPVRLDGRSVLVTGASRGIGRAVAVGLAQAGADVHVLARGAEALAELAVANHPLQVAVGGGHQTHVDGNRAAAADALTMVDATQALGSSSTGRIVPRPAPNSAASPGHESHPGGSRFVDVPPAGTENTRFQKPPTPSTIRRIRGCTAR